MYMYMNTIDVKFLSGFWFMKAGHLTTKKMFASKNFERQAHVRNVHV